MDLLRFNLPGVREPFPAYLADRQEEAGTVPGNPPRVSVLRSRSEQVAVRLVVFDAGKEEFPAICIIEPKCLF